MVPTVAFGEAGINVYTSAVEITKSTAQAQSAPTRYDDGVEFLVVLVDNGDGFPDEIYTASSRPGVDYFYYRIDSGDWLPITNSPRSYHPIRISTMTTALYSGGNVRELQMKVVSAAAGRSDIAFGIDADCTVDYAQGRTPVHDYSHIIEYYSDDSPDFSSASGSGGTSSNISTAYSIVAGPNRPIATQVLPLNRYDEGAEFTVTVSGNSTIAAGDTLYIATSRPNNDYLYYRVGNDEWRPYYSGSDRVMGSAAIALTPLTHSTRISATVHEFKFKIVSTSTGTSQIVFGINAVDVADYASGRSLTQSRLNNIIQQRKYAVEYSTTGASTGTSSNINTTYSVVSGPSGVHGVQTLPLTRNDAGAEFTVTVVGTSTITNNDRLYIASSRPDYDYLYYRIDNGEWIPYYNGTDRAMGGALTLTPFTHSSTRSATVHEIRLKVVSTADGISDIVFGTNANDVRNYALNLSTPNGLVNIIQQRRYTAEFSRTGASTSTTNNIVAFESTVAFSERAAAVQALPHYWNMDGVEFTVSIKGTAAITANDRIYVATSRPDDDYLYYRLGTGEWQRYHPGNDTPMGAVATLTPFTHTTNVSSTTHEIRLKIVSNRPGTSQIVFGTNAFDAQEYAYNRTSSNALLNIINQRRFDAAFINASNNEQLLLYVDGYYNYGYGSPTTTSAGEKNMALAADQKPSGGTDYYTVSAMVISGGMPASGRDVFFSIPTGTGGTLSATRQATNASGRAEVRVSANAAGSLDVLARASGVAEQLGMSSRKDIVSVTFGPSVASTKNVMLMNINNPNMSVKGGNQEIDPGRGTKPMLLNGRTMVPIRAIVEAMGGTAGWEDTNRQITLQCNEFTVFMWVDSKEILANGVRKTVDVAPTIVDGRTMVPLRFAAENLGCEVDWVESTQQIIITY